MLIIGQNSNILLVYKGLYSTYVIILTTYICYLIQFCPVKNEKIHFGKILKIWSWKYKFHFVMNLFRPLWLLTWLFEKMMRDESLNLSIFLGNYFHCVINYLSLNRLTIYRAKCIGIVPSKFLPTSCFRYNSVKYPSELLIPKLKIYKTNTSLPGQVV